MAPRSNLSDNYKILQIYYKYTTSIPLLWRTVQNVRSETALLLVLNLQLWSDFSPQCLIVSHKVSKYGIFRSHQKMANDSPLHQSSGTHRLQRQKVPGRCRKWHGKHYIMKLTASEQKVNFKVKKNTSHYSQQQYRMRGMAHCKLRGAKQCSSSARRSISRPPGTHKQQ